MATDVVQAVTQYAKKILGKERFRYSCTVLANCKMRAVELEEQDEAPALDQEALIIAGYLHDISTVEHGDADHHLKSAEMAAAFLRTLDVPAERINRVERAIQTHSKAVTSEERESIPLEGRILYDADKLGRLSGLAIVTALIEFGAHYPNRALNGETLAAILRHIEERFVDLFQSLNTAPAREMAREKFNNTFAFLDGVIEHLSESTPV
jgi:HD superfamily phosphodiesterase